MKILQFVLPAATLIAIMLIPDDVDRMIGLIIYAAIVGVYTIVLISDVCEEMRQINIRFEEEMRQITERYRKACEA